MEESHEVGDVEVKPTVGNSLFSLEVLSVIKESQQQHGLRHGDYQRYRSYCTRRLRRIRKSVNLVQGIKSRYIPKKLVPSNTTDVRCLFIPLVEAERCWSFAMQLKAEANENPRRRFHMINKLRKAVCYAKELFDLCEQISVDARTKLEAQAYYEWMSGSLQFELKQWKSAMELLTKAKLIYEKLTHALSGDAVTIYSQRVNDVEPSIRYCAYNIGDTTAVKDLVGIRLAMGHTDAILDELIQKTREKQAKSLEEVTWRGRVIPVRTNKIQAFLLAEKESEAEVKAAGDMEKKISVYDRVIKECLEALQAVREELKSDEVFKKLQRGQQVEGRLPENIFLHTYLQYLKIRKTIQRNHQMIEMYKSSLGKPATEGQKVIRPQDVARLYEIIIQSLNEIPGLAGLSEDVQLGNEIQTEITANRAFRCYYLALSHSKSNQWPEVVALSKHSQQYVAQLKNTSYSKEHALALEELTKDLESLLIQAQASSILDTTNDLTKDMSKLSISSDKRPIAERLDEYMPEDPAITNKKIILIKTPPNMKSIPCKPLFFDLALNHVQLPNVSHKLAKEEKKAGITGFVKSWIGGWGGKK